MAIVHLNITSLTLRDKEKAASFFFFAGTEANFSPCQPARMQSLCMHVRGMGALMSSCHYNCPPASTFLFIGYYGDWFGETGDDPWESFHLLDPLLPQPKRFEFWAEIKPQTTPSSQSTLPDLALWPSPLKLPLAPLGMLLPTPAASGSAWPPGNVRASKTNGRSWEEWIENSHELVISKISLVNMGLFGLGTLKDSEAGKREDA